jgi:hypothetical protein
VPGKDVTTNFILTKKKLERFGFIALRNADISEGARRGERDWQGGSNDLAQIVVIHQWRPKPKTFTPPSVRGFAHTLTGRQCPRDFLKVWLCAPIPDD